MILTGVNPNPTINLIGVRSKIEPALCFKQQCTVAKDNTITFEDTVFQIPKKSPYRSFANKRIDVHVLLDGAMEFFYQKENRPLRFQNDARICPISNERQAGRVPLWTSFYSKNKRHELSP